MQELGIMTLKLHPSARTNAKLRREIQQSGEFRQSETRFVFAKVMKGASAYETRGGGPAEDDPLDDLIDQTSSGGSGGGR